MKILNVLTTIINVLTTIICWSSFIILSAKSLVVTEEYFNEEILEILILFGLLCLTTLVKVIIGAKRKNKQIIINSFFPILFFTQLSIFYADGHIETGADQKGLFYILFNLSEESIKIITVLLYIFMWSIIIVKTKFALIRYGKSSSFYRNNEKLILIIMSAIVFIISIAYAAVLLFNLKLYFLAKLAIYSFIAYWILYFVAYIVHIQKAQSEEI